MLKRRQAKAYIPSNEIWAKRTHSVSNSSSRKIRHQNTNSENERKNLAEKTVTPLEFEEEPQFLDRICRIIFPASFSIFSFVYWLCFLKSGT